MVTARIPAVKDAGNVCVKVDVGGNRTCQRYLTLTFFK
jgi:hypothetical protein